MADELNNPSGRALLLGGTVALPSFPTTGLMSCKPQEIRTRYGEWIAGDDLVAIEQVIQPSTLIVRVVKRTDVRAFFKPKEGGRPWEGDWSAMDRPARGKDSDPPVRGILFVAEGAPVMTIAVFSGTAGESADYCPPTCMRDCDCDRKWSLKEAGGSED